MTRPDTPPRVRPQDPDQPDRQRPTAPVGPRRTGRRAALIALVALLTASLGLLPAIPSATADPATDGPAAEATATTDPTPADDPTAAEDADEPAAAELPAATAEPDEEAAPETAEAAPASPTATPSQDAGRLQAQPRAAATELTIYVNSARFGDPTNSAKLKGDATTCTTGQTINGQPECTLQAAVEFSNKIKNTLPVTITVADGFSGTIEATASPSGMMLLYTPPNYITGFDDRHANAAYWHITAPVTIDLKNRLQVSSSFNVDVAAFYVEASNVTLRNLTNILSGSSSIVVSKTSAHILIEGGSTIQTANFYADHFLVIENGATDVTFQNYTVGGLRGVEPRSGNGAVAFDGFNESLTAQNITIQNVTFRSPRTGTECSATDGSGCVNTAISLGHDGNKTKIDKLTITGCTFENIISTDTPQHAISGYHAGSLSNLTITNNTFRNIYTSSAEDWWQAAVTLPADKPLGGSNKIGGPGILIDGIVTPQKNTFDNSGIVSSGQSYAIGWKSNQSGSTDSNLTIEYNHFDGFAQAGVHLESTGLTVVRLNTFGPNHVSQTGGGTEAAGAHAATYSSDEETATSGVMVANYDSSANQQISTWYPAGTPLMRQTSNGCQAFLWVVPPTTGTIPPTNVTIDVYWTADNQAEVYIASYSISTASDLETAIPAQAIDPETGQISGYLRVQTQTSIDKDKVPHQSSQYSRRIALPSSCQAATPGVDVVVEVNSTRFGGPQYTGLTTCYTGERLADGYPECTLRAAIELSNQINDIAPVKISLAEYFEGGTIATTKATGNWMLPSGQITNFGDAFRSNGAYWHIKAPVTIDLDNRLHSSNQDNETAAAFYVDAADVTLRNLTDIMAGASAIVVSGRANHIVIEGGSTVQTANYNTDHFLVIENGAKNVTFQNYTVGGLRNLDMANGGGAVVFDDFNDPATPGGTTSLVLIDGVSFHSPKTGSACSTADGSGCDNNAITVGYNNHPVRVDGLTITNCVFEGITSGTTDLTAFAGRHAGSLSNLKITDNDFRDIFASSGTNWYRALIILPENSPLGGSSLISGNTFDNSDIVSAEQSNAIAWNSNLSGTTASHLVIEDNYFDGFARTGIRLEETGLVTVRRNTFGPNHASQTSGTTTASGTNAATYSGNEENSTNEVMLSNGSAANQQIRTWHPTGTPQAAQRAGGCQSTLQATPPTAGTAPAKPVTIDVYWTPDRQAEIYLGSYGPFDAAASFDVPVPIQAIDALSGAVSGYVRFQTQTNSGLDQTESSQYSRRIGLAGACDAAPLNPKTTVEVNSDRFGGPNRGGFAGCDTGRVLADGVTPECTLRAAIELSNAIGRGSAVTIKLADDFAGGVIPTAGTIGDWMLVSGKITAFASSYKAKGAYWHITAPVTIDLDNRLQTSNSDNVAAAAFYVTAQNVTLRNLTNIMAGSSSIVVAGTAENVMVEGGSTIQTANYNTDHFLVIENGAKKVTFRDYTVGGLRPVAPEPGSAAVAFDGVSKEPTTGVTIKDPTTAITIQDIVFRSPQTGSECSATDGSGCVNTAISLGHSSSKTNINGLTITDCRFENIISVSNTLHAVHGYHTGALSNLTITHNQFINVFVDTTTTWYKTVVQLPLDKPLGGVNRISNNIFDNSAIVGLKPSYAIGWNSNKSGTAASNLMIEDNYFDGFARAGVYLTETGLVTLRRNTFGPNQTSQTGGSTAANGNNAATSSSDEETATNGVLVANATSANQRIHTWYPSGKPTAELSAAADACVATVQAIAPTSSKPATPVTIDVYWTPNRQAEVYLGAYSGFSTSPATITFPIPRQAVDPVSGQVSGFIRFQTQTTNSGASSAYAQTESSQYSRLIALAGQCEPSLYGEDALAVQIQGWTAVQSSVPGEAATYDDIMATGRPLVSGATVWAGIHVWWTYSVVNQGETRLTDVVVTDSVLGEICRLASLEPGQSAGCAANGIVHPARPTG
ncbi:MAG: hypothetical protein LBK42_11780 [Propionibacteriaceae bacterium]|jgi:hypothetical protein|nr:hypothetical protein [Propionibacteriaceae bacterium]